MMDRKDSRSRTSTGPHGRPKVIQHVRTKSTVSTDDVDGTVGLLSGQSNTAQDFYPKGSNAPIDFWGVVQVADGIRQFQFGRNFTGTWWKMRLEKSGTDRRLHHIVVELIFGHIGWLVKAAIGTDPMLLVVDRSHVLSTRCLLSLLFFFSNDIFATVGVGVSRTLVGVRVRISFSSVVVDIVESEGYSVIGLLTVGREVRLGSGSLSRIA